LNELKIMTFLVAGTVFIALAAGWVLKRFGPRK
jgi:hypothetical protein